MSIYVGDRATTMNGCFQEVYLAVLMSSKFDRLSEETARSWKEGSQRNPKTDTLQNCELREWKQ